MVDSEKTPENYNFRTCIEAIIKNPEMLTFTLDHIKTKKVCKNAAKKLLFIIMYVPD